jgi:hypothetical protein
MSKIFKNLIYVGGIAQIMWAHVNKLIKKFFKSDSSKCWQGCGAEV